MLFCSNPHARGARQNCRKRGCRCFSYRLAVSVVLRLWVMADVCTTTTTISSPSSFCPNRCFYVFIFSGSFVSAASALSVLLGLPLLSLCLQPSVTSVCCTDTTTNRCISQMVQILFSMTHSVCMRIRLKGFCW